MGLAHSEPRLDRRSLAAPCRLSLYHLRRRSAGHISHTPSSRYRHSHARKHHRDSIHTASSPTAWYARRILPPASATRRSATAAPPTSATAPARSAVRLPPSPP